MQNLKLPKYTISDSQFTSHLDNSKDENFKVSLALSVSLEDSTSSLYSYGMIINKKLVLILQVHMGRFIVQIGMGRYIICFLCSVILVYFSSFIFFSLKLPQLRGCVILPSDKDQPYVE